MNEDPESILRELGLGDAEIRVYLAMVGGAATARDILNATGQKRPTVYYALGALERRGLVARSGASGYVLLESEHLADLADERATDAQELAERVRLALPAFTPKTQVSTRPAVASFEGKEAVSRTVLDMLYARDGTIDVLAPTDNFFRQLGEPFLEQFVARRKERGIKTRSLWETPTSAAVFKRYYEGVSQVRIVPSVMRGKFPMSVFLYDDQVLYVSSVKSAHAFLIASAEHCETMRAWFDGLWSVSKPHAR